MKRSMMICVALASLTSFIAPAFAANTSSSTMEKRPGMTERTQTNVTPGQKAVVKHKVKKQAVKKHAVKKHVTKKAAVKKHIKKETGTKR